MPKVRYLDDGEGDILRDGEILRTHMLAKDAARSISGGAFGDNTRYDSPPARATIVDTLGQSNPMQLRRPGYRFLQYDKHSTDHARQATQTVMRVEMYDDIKNELSNSWRSPEPGAYHASNTTHAGDACTVDGKQGRLVEVAGSPGWLTCEPTDGRVGNRTDALPVNDSREAAYSDYQNYVENAWRSK